MAFSPVRLGIFYHSYREKILRVAVIAAVLLGSFLAVDAPRWADGHARFFALNVGQGDALLLRSGEGENVLIDGGPDDTVLKELGSVLPFFDRTIDVVILTHPDADHLSGLVDVLQRYNVKRLLLTGVAKDTATYKKFFAVINERTVPLTFTVAPMHFAVDEMLFTVIWPIEGFVGENVASANDTCITVRVDVGKESVLLPGDISELAEMHMVAQESALLDVDILKAPHHGSKTSSSLPFLEAVSPKVVVISVGKGNRYGHPTQEAMARMQKVGATVRRTDLEGRIELLLD